eukprot:UN04206
MVKYLLRNCVIYWYSDSHADIQNILSDVKVDRFGKFIWSDFVEYICPKNTPEITKPDFDLETISPLCDDLNKTLLNKSGEDRLTKFLSSYQKK